MSDATATARSVPFSPTGAVVPHRATFRQRMLARLIYLAVRAVAATLRYRWERPPGELPAAGHPYIFAVWHNRLALSLILYRRFLRESGVRFRMAAIVSASRDGALATRVLELFGIEPVRGSSSRRGVQALLEMGSWLDRGYDVAATSDGPRGPRYEMKPGVVALAQLSGRAIVPVSYHVSRKITVQSWDRFQIPLPFSTCLFKFGDPVSVPRRISHQEREALRESLEATLRQITVD